MGTWLDEQPADKRDALLAQYREHRARMRVAEHDGGDERFGVWLALVDRRITRAVGIGLFDLADWNMRDAHDDGMSPREAALEALRSDDLYASLVEEAGL
jgi:hypothetical protein